jgi:hypothetical protein
MKKIYSILLALVLLSACTPDETVWPEVTKEMRPWVRWWWLGSAVDEANLNAELKKYAAKGIGGVEITPIYGAKGFEDKYIDFLSPRWMEVLDYTLRTADSLGMGVDMNTGTGWPFGGPHITLEHAATRIIVQKYYLKAGQKLARYLWKLKSQTAIGCCY